MLEWFIGYGCFCLLAFVLSVLGDGLALLGALRAIAYITPDGKGLLVAFGP